MFRKGILIALMITIGPLSWSATQNYRLILTEHPANSILIGWELLAGCPDTQRVYYDTVDHGQDTSAYQYSTSISASYFHQGMENYFSKLNNLEPNTAYYFVIAEDEGISSRFWFRTFSDDNQPWWAYWISAEPGKIQDYWNRLASHTATNNPDLVLAEGLNSLQTESAWRKWLQEWQHSISDDGRIVPLLIMGAVSNDLRYLFNLSTESVQTYFLSSACVFITTDGNKPLRKKALKSLPNSAFILGHSPVSETKISTKIDLLLTQLNKPKNPHPGVFYLSKHQPFVKIAWQDKHLEIVSVEGKQLLDAYAN